MALSNGDILVYNGSQWVNQPTVPGPFSVNPGPFSVGLLAAPTGLTLTASASGGSLATGTYYYRITALESAGGETVGGTEASVAVTGPNGSVSVTWNGRVGATSYRVYRGTTAGGENTYYTATTPPFTDTGAAGTSGSPPSVGTALANRISQSSDSWFAGGNVGIGVSNPQTRLHLGGVFGNIGLRVDPFDQGTILSSYNGSASFSQQFVLQHNRGNVTIQNLRGNILISPTASLFVAAARHFGTELGTPGQPTLQSVGSGTLSGTFFYKITALDAAGAETVPGTEQSITVSNVASISVTWTAVSGAASYRVYRGTATGAEDHYFAATSASYSDTGTTGTAGSPPTLTTAFLNKIAASGNSWLMAGNVGIGTASPGAKMTVNGVARADSFVVGADTALNSAELYLTSGGAEMQTVWKDTAAGTDLKTLRLATRSSGKSALEAINDAFSAITYTFLLLDHSNGNVGIGTTGPDFRLDVSGDIRVESSNKLYFGGTGSADNDTNLYRSAADTLKTDDTLLVGNKVGIGTTSPNSSLHVAGPVTTATRTVSSNTTLQDSDSVIFVNASGGAVTITVPAASNATIGRVYYLFKIDTSSNWLSVIATGSDTLGGTTFGTTTQWECIRVTGYTSTSWILNRWVAG